jgi:hypothetical protein
MEKIVVQKSVRGEEILPPKDGTRTLVYPACGTDNPWIRILKPDIFIGIDLDSFDSNPFDILGCKTKSILYSRRDAINIPEIPISDEVALLLKIFWGIKSPYSHSSLEDTPKVTEEMHKRYQEENIGCLKEYLKACEESALRRTFVIDCDGYESVIASQGYRKILSHEPFNCFGTFTFCDSMPCEKAMPLFDWESMDKMLGYACSQRERVTITSDERNYPVTLPILATYVKEMKTK